MAKKAILTKSDFLDFNFAKETAKSLIDNPKTQSIGLFIAIGIYTGLRYSDVIDLTWKQLQGDNFTIAEKKTKKVRTITISNDLRAIISKGVQQHESIFISQKNALYSVQSINRILKTIFKNQLQSKNISTHTMRKTFGRRVWEINNKSEDGLIMLMDLFNHSSLKITKDYLGITAEDRAMVYLSL